jgi:hypothetical protein
MKKSVRKSRTIPRDTANPKAMFLADLVAKKVLNPEFLFGEVYEVQCDRTRQALEDCVRADYKAKGVIGSDEEEGLHEKAMFYIGVAIGQRLGGAR